MSLPSQPSSPSSPSLPPYIRSHERGFGLHLKVVPNASRSRVVGVLGDRLKIAVAAPAESGKANAAVCQLLAATLGISPSQVAISAGLSRPQKTATITGMALMAAVAVLPSA